METGAVYSDFGQLASLRADAKADPKAALKDVAQQFESLFIQQMLKSMRDATVKGELFNSDQMDTYMSMADQQISVSLAENGGMGIARMLVEQMQTKGLVPGSSEGASVETPKIGVDSVMDSTIQASSLRFAPNGSTTPLKAFELSAANTMKMDVEG